MISSKIIATGILKAIGVLLFATLLFYFIFQIQAVFIYLLVSLILTLIGNPITDFLKNRLKFKNIFATITTLSIYIILVAGFIMMFIPLILTQGQNLSLLNTTEIETSSNQLINQIAVFMESYHIDSKLIFKDFKINFDFIPNFLNSILGIVGSFGMGLGAVLFITFFFLKDRYKFIEAARKLMPDSYKIQILNSLDKINHLLSRYLIGLILQLFIVFVLYLIVLLVFGIPNAFIIAFLCAVLNIIPYIGPLIASVLAAVLTMLSNLGNDFQTEILPTTLFVLIGFWLVQVIDNNFSQPIIFSKSVSSHPLEIFLIILIAGFLFGIIGMVIAVPLYTILKVLGKEFFPENKIIKLLTKNL